MAIPTQPTRTTIVTEALKKAGNLTPTAGELTRAEDEFLEEIKHTVSRRKDGQWTVMEEAATIPTVAGRQRNLLPADFGSTIREPLVLEDNNGDRSLVEEVTIQKIDDYEDPLEEGVPDEYSVYRGELYLYKVPDKSTYSLQLRYWLDITKLDYGLSKHAEILRLWRETLVLGVYWKVLQDLKDEREPLAEADFFRSLDKLSEEDSQKKESGQRLRVKANIVV